MADDPHAQDESTWTGHDPEHDSVVPPAPANQTLPDEGLAPAAPAPNAAASALRRIGTSLRNLVRRGR